MTRLFLNKLLYISFCLKEHVNHQVKVDQIHNFCLFGNFVIFYFILLHENKKNELQNEPYHGILEWKLI